MTPEQQAAFIMAQASCAMAEIAGMQAENASAAFRGYSPKYREKDFERVAQNNLVGHNDVITFFQQ